MTTPNDEERVGMVMREMLNSVAQHTPPVAPSELRSRAESGGLRSVDAKVLVSVAAGAAALVALIAFGPLRSDNQPPRSPTATQPTNTTTTTTTTTTARAATQLDLYVAAEAQADEAALAASSLNARFGNGPFVSVHSVPVTDDGTTVAVVAFAYNPGGHPVQVLQYRDGHWTPLAGLAAPAGQAGADIPASFVFLDQGPVSVADVTGDGRPDFLILSTAADNIPGFVVSQDGGTWRYVPFSGPYEPTGTDVVGRNPEFQGHTLVSDYDDCLPDCASGQNTALVWSYHRSTGEFTAPDPPGFGSSPTDPGGS